MKIPTITKPIEDVLWEKTLLPVETCGRIIYLRGRHPEALVAVETGRGSAGHVDAAQNLDLAIEHILRETPELDSVDFHVHPAYLGASWHEALSIFEGGDVQTMQNMIAFDPSYTLVFVSPKFYAFLGAASATGAGIDGYSFSWGTAPKATPSFAVRGTNYSREQLAEMIAQEINKKLEGK